MLARWIPVCLKEFRFSRQSEAVRKIIGASLRDRRSVDQRQIEERSPSSPPSGASGRCCLSATRTGVPCTVTTRSVPATAPGEDRGKYRQQGAQRRRPQLGRLGHDRDRQPGTCPPSEQAAEPGDRQAGAHRGTGPQHGMVFKVVRVPPRIVQWMGRCSATAESCVLTRT